MCCFDAYIVTLVRSYFNAQMMVYEAHSGKSNKIGFLVDNELIR